MIYRNIVNKNIEKASSYLGNNCGCDFLKKSFGDRGYISKPRIISYHREEAMDITDSIKALRSEIAKFPITEEQFLTNYKLDEKPQLIYIPFVHVNTSASSGHLFYSDGVERDTFGDLNFNWYQAPAGEGKGSFSGFQKGFEKHFSKGNWMRKYIKESVPQQGSRYVSPQKAVDRCALNAQYQASKSSKKRAYKEIDRMFDKYDSFTDKMKAKADVAFKTATTVYVEAVEFIAIYLFSINYNNKAYKFYVFPETMEVMYDKRTAKLLKALSLNQKQKKKQDAKLERKQDAFEKREEKTGKKLNDKIDYYRKKYKEKLESDKKNTKTKKQ